MGLPLVNLISGQTLAKALAHQPRTLGLLHFGRANTGQVLGQTVFAHKPAQFTTDQPLYGTCPGGYLLPSSRACSVYGKRQALSTQNTFSMCKRHDAMP